MEPTRKTSDEATNSPEMMIPIARLLLARVNCRTIRSNPRKSSRTLNSPCLIDSKDWLSRSGKSVAIRCRSSVVRSVWLKMRAGRKRRSDRCANEGVEVCRDIEMRVEGPPDALDGHERADQEDQIRRNVQVVRADDADKLAKE